MKTWKRECEARDLWAGEFEADFLIEGEHYQYGAWSTDGNWVMAWNDDAEFWQELGDLDEQLAEDKRLAGESL